MFPHCRLHSEILSYFLRKFKQSAVYHVSKSTFIQKIWTLLSFLFIYIQKIFVFPAKTNSNFWGFKLLIFLFQHSGGTWIILDCCFAAADCPRQSAFLFSSPDRIPKGARPLRVWLLLVPLAGLEPARCCHLGILSLIWYLEYSGNYWNLLYSFHRFLKL